jgi:hypothetical protein
MEATACFPDRFVLLVCQFVGELVVRVGNLPLLPILGMLGMPAVLWVRPPRRESALVTAPETL